MFKNQIHVKFALFMLAMMVMFASGLMAKDVLVRINSEDYKNGSFEITKELDVIAQENGKILARCSDAAAVIFNEVGFEYELIKSSDHIITDDLAPVPESGILLGAVIKPGSQGATGWHEGVAMAGSVLAYMETDVEGQLPGFTFWDMEKDSTWHHYIDTDLEGDDALFMAASDNMIYYTFHFNNPAIHNSDMRYYWYNVSTGEHGEVENFGYGYEGFGVSDTWMMRVGNKGMGWNNQIFAHNMETGARFELLVDSTYINSWWYYDNFGSPSVNGNTVVFTYIDFQTYTPDLKVYSLGADGEFSTSDDVPGILSQSGGTHTATGYGQYRIDGRYIVWVERITGDDGNIKGFDMGPDELYGTADDVGAFDICTDPATQSNVRIDNNIIVWDDWRNSPASGHDIYGYDLNTSTEFKLTVSATTAGMSDLVNGEIVLIKKDWDTSTYENDIYFMNIYGRIQGEYYDIELGGGVPPMAKSYLTGLSRTSPYSFSGIVSGVKGPLCAVFINEGVGNASALSYSAVTGEWSTDILTAAGDDYTAFIDGDNAMIIGVASPNYMAYTFNGTSGTFSAKVVNIPKPTGFATGKNISFVWGDDSTSHWIKTYDAELNTWSSLNGTTNDPWHVIATEFSDSLGLILHAQGDTICSHTQVQVYDLELHDWVYMGVGVSRLNTINIHEWEKTIQMDANAHFAIVTQEYDSYYNDYIYTCGTGEDLWKVKPTLSGYAFDKPILGENFIVQGGRSGNVWQGHIYNGSTSEWIPDYIESQQGIDRLITFEDLMLAWRENQPWNATLWAYSSNSDGIQEKTIQYPGTNFTVKAASKAAYVLAASGNYTKNHLHVFNGLKGEWKDPLEVYNTSQFMIEATGHTGIIMQQEGSMNGTAEIKAYGYSAFKDEWDVFEFRSNEVDGIFTSDFCGLLAYNHYYHGNKQIHAFNGVEGEWSKDVIEMYNTYFTGLSMNDRIMIVIEDNPTDYVYGKVHVFSPILDRWNSMIFDTPGNYAIDQCMTTPTSAFAWNESGFRIIYSPDIEWDKKIGRLEELHVTDYAIAATIGSTTHYFYPPRTEIINEFEITEGPTINVESSWATEISWKTNMNSDTRLVWGVDGYYGIIEKDTLPEEYTKDHRVLIEGLEANKTYYYGAISIIAGVDTVHSDTLNFNTGTDTEAPVLVKAPRAYRIHDDAASVWWETNEPSTAIVQWGLTTAYSDTLEYSDEAYITNSIRMYGLAKDTTYHYRVGGYDRYGNGPFFSGDYTFRTHNELPVVTNLAQADSTLWGAAYMTWEPPRLDSNFARESFNHGIPVDWKIYNRGDNRKGSTWTGGYIGDNPVAYCAYGQQGEKQEEWLISNPITIDGTTGGVLNFWHMGFYNDYDNAPNKVMVSWTGTDPSNFTTVWSSQDLPDDWSLVQINLNYTANYGKTMYIAFVYESTFGETWAIDNIYMDFDVDGYYENFNDLTGWTNQGGHWGLRGTYNDYSLGVEGIKESAYLPDPIQTWDAWEISPSLKVTESHHILGFWQSGWGGEYDTKPNEIRVVHGLYSIEASSEVVRTVYPVPNGWMWTTVDLSAYIGQTIMIGFRYQSHVGNYWNGEEWLAYWGEDWYIDDMYLFENAPAMVADPNAKPNEKPLKFASSPNGKPIDMGQFKTINPVQTMPENLASEAPGGSIDLPKEKPLIAISLPKIMSDPAPSGLAEPKPELYGYEVYGRYPGDNYFDYLGYVTSPSFVDWGTYLGYESEYYVEAVYDLGNSQPSEKVMIAGGESLKENEYAYDSGVLYYSYWWYPGNSFANEFTFQDSVLKVEQIKVHVAKPGTYKLRLSTFATDGTIVPQFTTASITAQREGWYAFNVSSSVEASNDFLVEFMPQDTLVQLSYDTYNVPGVSWFHYSDGSWQESDYVFYIRLIGEKSPIVGVTDIPSEFKLEQNYPNPFNPTTTIAFEIPEAVDASVKIYDIGGKLVQTLLDGHRAAGRYDLIWDARNSSGNQVASGVYLIKMTAGDYTETRKMVLVR
jgi:FlgD Ig-like domain